MNMPALSCPYVKTTENKEDTMTEEKLYQNRDASIRNLQNTCKTIFKPQLTKRRKHAII